MKISGIFKNQKVMNAIFIGTLCSVAYLAVYFVRNILSAVTPQMIEAGFTEAYIGRVSSAYFISYAVGQLINGVIGDKIKAKYMISLGLLLSAITNLMFSGLAAVNENTAMIAYGLSGFFLAMIYGPMTKVVAENTEPVYATRCTLGYTFASFIGTPFAGVAAAVFVWQDVFLAGSVSLMAMAVVCFIFFAIFEKKGIVKYNQYNHQVEKGGGIKVLLKHQIVKFTLVSILTGVVRTTVVFWLPTYLTQYLNFATDTSAMVFTVSTFIISLETFIVIYIYEKLGSNMDLTLLIMFVAASVFFLLVYLIKMPILNVVFIVIAIMSSNGAATMLFSRYLPSLRDTGMVSSATGFLDFISYMAAAASSTIFANAVSEIGWGNLILVWVGLMVAGVVVALPYKKR